MQGPSSVTIELQVEIRARVAPSCRPDTPTTGCPTACLDAYRGHCSGNATGSTYGESGANDRAHPHSHLYTIGPPTSHPCDPGPSNYVTHTGMHPKAATVVGLRHLECSVCGGESNRKTGMTIIAIIAVLRTFDDL